MNDMSMSETRNAWQRYFNEIHHQITLKQHIMQLLKVYLLSIKHLAKGEIDKGLVALATALSSIASSLEEDAEELPTIIIDTEET